MINQKWTNKNGLELFRFLGDTQIQLNTEEKNKNGRNTK